MKNYVNQGNILELTAPVGGVVSGTGYVIGSLFVVALHSADAGAIFSAVSEGVVEMAKEATTAVFAEGDQVFWNDTAKEWDTTASGYYPAGTALEAKLATDATVKVKLNGSAVVVVP